MATFDDLPPIRTKDLKRRSNKTKKRRIIKKQLEELISNVVRAAHVVRDKGFYIVSPEAIQCVKILRDLRTLPLTATLIAETDAFRTLQFLSNNGNPKIRSESRAVIDHWKVILQYKSQ